MTDDQKIRPVFVKTYDMDMHERQITVKALRSILRTDSLADAKEIAAKELAKAVA